MLAVMFSRIRINTFLNSSRYNVTTTFKSVPNIKNAHRLSRMSILTFCIDKKQSTDSPMINSSVKGNRSRTNLNLMIHVFNDSIFIPCLLTNYCSETNYSVHFSILTRAIKLFLPELKENVVIHILSLL